MRVEGLGVRFEGRGLADRVEGLEVGAVLECLRACGSHVGEGNGRCDAMMANAMIQ